MKRETKNEKELKSKLPAFNLTSHQTDGILKNYPTHKNLKISIKQAQRFKDINSSQRVRDFAFVCAPEVKRDRGVYKITWDSNKFYIGRSKHIGTRVSQYEAAIYNYFKTGTYPELHYLSKVFENLNADQMAYFFKVELLNSCYSVEDLQITEQKWLDTYKDDPNCVNIGFIAKKPQNEIDETLEEQLERKSNTIIIKKGGKMLFIPKKNLQSSAVSRRSESLVKHTLEKKMQATEYSLNVPEMLSELGHTVYKLYYGDRYVVNKGKTLAGSLFLMQKGLGYYLAYDHHKESKFEKDYFSAFYEFIRKNPNKAFRVEIVLTSADAYEILKTEQLELNKAMKYKKCLNGNIQSYVPTLNPKTGMHGWITPEQVDRYYTFMSSL